ncbi:NACHT C-terminal helical domain 2-containing protein [Microcoleus vaginatus]|uniref:NACHT C-terminal helical domain 2-containing protein n=1 Tax=Microcoleus vaginatus TaxID=119532 RepID=UPI0032A262D2
MGNFYCHITNRKHFSLIVAYSILSFRALPADELLLLMKQKVDGLVADDEQLQQFLLWVNQKSLSVDFPYKPAAVRFFYFSLLPSLELALNRNPERFLDPALYLAVKHTFDPAVEFTLDLAILLVLHGAIGPALSLAHDILLVPLVEPELMQALQKLKKELPHPDGDKEIFREWWQANGQVWTRELRQIIIYYRNIGHDWLFSEQQKSLLRKYYDANKLLVYCLNSGCNLSPTVRQEIEGTLLLPIANLQTIGDKCDRPL